MKGQEKTMQKKIQETRDLYVATQEQIVTKIANDLCHKIDEEVRQKAYSRTVWSSVANAEMRTYAATGGLKSADEAVKFVTENLTKLFGGDVTITCTKFGDKWIFNLSF